MSKILENLSINGAQLETLRDSKPYGHVYFDVEKGVWIIDFYTVDGKSYEMPCRFIKEIIGVTPNLQLGDFNYKDKMFSYKIDLLNGAFSAGYAIITPII